MTLAVTDCVKYITKHYITTPPPLEATMFYYSTFKCSMLNVLYHLSEMDFRI